MSLYNRIGRGTYWRALNFGRELVKSGHSVTVLAMSDRRILRFTEYYDDGVRIIESPDLLPGIFRSGWDIWDVVRRILRVKHLHFDLVHSFECRPVAIYPALYLHKIQKIPLVTDWGDWFGRGGSVEERANPFIRMILRPIETYYEENYRADANGTTVINEFLRNKAIGLGVDPGTILLLRNGSDIKNIQPLPKEEAREQLHLPRLDPIIGYIGSIFHQDAELMAEAFLKMKEDMPNVKLLVAGYFNADIEMLTGCPESIIRTGVIDFKEIGLFLSACDICWLPLRDSGANRGRWPIKLNDFIAAGCPVVTTDVGDLGEFVTDNGFGLVSPDVAHKLSEVVLSLISDPERCLQMGMKARHIAETTYSWKNVAKQLENFYVRVI